MVSGDQRMSSRDNVADIPDAGEAQHSAGPPVYLLNGLNEFGDIDDLCDMSICRRRSV